MLNANAAQSLLQTRGFFTCAKALQGDCPSGKSQGAYYTHGQLVNISAKLWNEANHPRMRSRKAHYHLDTRKWKMCESIVFYCYYCLLFWDGHPQGYDDMPSLRSSWFLQLSKIKMAIACEPKGTNSFSHNYSSLLWSSMVRFCLSMCSALTVSTLLLPSLPSHIRFNMIQSEERCRVVHHVSLCFTTFPDSKEGSVVRCCKHMTARSGGGLNVSRFGGGSLCKIQCHKACNNWNQWWKPNLKQHTPVVNVVCFIIGLQAV